MVSSVLFVLVSARCDSPGSPDSRRGHGLLTLQYVAAKALFHLQKVWALCVSGSGRNAQVR